MPKKLEYHGAWEPAGVEQWLAGEGMPAGLPPADVGSNEAYLGGLALPTSGLVDYVSDGLGSDLALPPSRHGNPEAALHPRLTQEVMETLGLNQQEADVICGLFGVYSDEHDDQQKLQQLSAKYGVTDQRIKQIKKSALDKLQSRLYFPYTGLAEILGFRLPDDAPPSYEPPSRARIDARRLQHIEQGPYKDRLTQVTNGLMPFTTARAYGGQPKVVAPFHTDRVQASIDRLFETCAVAVNPEKKSTYTRLILNDLARDTVDLRLQIYQRFSAGNGWADPASQQEEITSLIINQYLKPKILSLKPITDPRGELRARLTDPGRLAETRQHQQRQRLQVSRMLLELAAQSGLPQQDLEEHIQGIANPDDQFVLVMEMSYNLAAYRREIKARGPASIGPLRSRRIMLP